MAQIGGLSNGRACAWRHGSVVLLVVALVIAGCGGRSPKPGPTASATGEWTGAPTATTWASPSDSPPGSSPGLSPSPVPGSSSSPGSTSSSGSGSPSGTSGAPSDHGTSSSGGQGSGLWVAFDRAVGPKQWGDPPFTVSASATPGASVSYSAAGACRLAGMRTVQIMTV